VRAISRAARSAPRVDATLQATLREARAQGVLVQAAAERGHNRRRTRIIDGDIVPRVDTSHLRGLLLQFAERIADQCRRDIAAEAMSALGSSPSGPRGARQVRARRSARPKVVSSARHLQGQYLGHLRALRGEARRRVQTLARRDGVAAAVELARRLRS
jgi:hypothetical protein